MSLLYTVSLVRHLFNTPLGTVKCTVIRPECGICERKELVPDLLSVGLIAGTPTFPKTCFTEEVLTLFHHLQQNAKVTAEGFIKTLQQMNVFKPAQADALKRIKTKDTNRNKQKEMLKSFRIVSRFFLFAEHQCTDLFFLREHDSKSLGKYNAAKCLACPSKPEQVRNRL